MNAVVDAPVTFWGAKWWKDNQISTGEAPAAFKGFVRRRRLDGLHVHDHDGKQRPAIRRCLLPPVVTVLVASSVVQSGSTVTGTISEFALVATNDGYDTNPGHPGTGTVIGFVPCGGTLLSTAAVSSCKIRRSPTSMLFDPASHEPLTERPWDERRARAAIAAVVADAESAFDDDALWPAHPLDEEGGPLPRVTSLYLGAAGVVWALHRLAAAGGVELRRDWAPVAVELVERYAAAAGLPGGGRTDRSRRS